MRRRHFLTGAAAAAGGWLMSSPVEATAGAGGQSEGFSVKNEGGDLSVRDRGRPVLVYRHTPVTGPPGTGPLFTRSGYIHPLHAPNGAVVTDDFAPDHAHQRGVFFAWTKTQVKELHPDFWNLGSGLGRVRSLRVQGKASTGQPARLEAGHLWEMRRGEAWESALEESWEVVLHPARFHDPQDPKAAYVL